MMDPETIRLAEDAARKENWKRWGPYLSERQWGTVREDYSAEGSCWDYFPFEHSHSRTYRWGEDGLFGITDRQCRLCFSVALWNEKDPIIKERLFGLTGPQGNHGEDVKECYYYLDSTPTHSYMKGLYKYPQQEFPYQNLKTENQRRGKSDPEYELEDTGVFSENRYYDVQVEYAKASPDDILIRVTISNRGPERARLHFLPTLWFRNSWSWGCTHEGCEMKPKLFLKDPQTVQTQFSSLGDLCFSAESEKNGKPTFLFTENESNYEALFGSVNVQPYVKDAFHRWLIQGKKQAVNPKQTGTKCAAHWKVELEAGEEKVFCFRLTAMGGTSHFPFGKEFESCFEKRISEADRFYKLTERKSRSEDAERVARQAYAGLLWSKQFYHFAVKDWMQGDPDQPRPPASRTTGRNREWTHLFNRDIISMPDKWEYPWYAAWDLAFHTVAFAKIDPEFAKDQLLLLMREWYMHPNGQIPAYEFEFGDVNPPVHAWACWRVYKMTAPKGKRDRDFLSRSFHKLLLNFTWWVNRKDPEGRNIFGGGFLGLDNIGIFDRSKPLPGGGQLAQADGTAWMAFYCLTMLNMALELATYDQSYEDVASKFFEHFVSIVSAINTMGGCGLWDEVDGFYYDQLRFDHGESMTLRVRSAVGIIPLFAVEILHDAVLDKLPGFRKRMEWFLNHQKELAQHVTVQKNGETTFRLLSIPSKEQLQRVLRYVFDEEEFLSPYGVRSMSRFHAKNPYQIQIKGEGYSVGYDPGESTSGLFGGNSNWRGPIWFPINYLLIEALERYHRFYGDSFTIEAPYGSGKQITLREASRKLSHRLCALFLKDKEGRRASHGENSQYQIDPAWKDLVLFHEYFHGETGKGLGASHQTGWTALVARLIEDVE